MTELIIPEKITSYSQYREIVDQILDYTSMTNLHSLFRGHELDFYTILPTLARNKYSTDEVLKLEMELFNNFKSSITNGYIGSTKIDTPNINNGYLEDWYLQFQARHLEIPSRLIDWTMDADVALFFAVQNENHYGKDGHVWFFPSSRNNYKNLDFPNQTLKKMFSEDYMHLNAGDGDQNILNTISPFQLEKNIIGSWLL